jgi:hypothetical protein
MFDGLSQDARVKLLEFFDGITAATLWPLSPPQRRPVAVSEPLAVRTVARLVKPGVVEVQFGAPPELLDLWVTELSKGRLFVHTTEYATLRAHLEVRLNAPHGTFSLETEVVHQVIFPPLTELPFGVGLQLVNFGEVKGRLEQFLQGAEAPPIPTTDPLRVASVFQAVKRFFAGLETGRARNALGLSAEATPLDQRARLLELKKLFSESPPGATPPQLARLDAALRALTRLERQLAVRDQSVAGDLAIIRPEAPEPPPEVVFEDAAPEDTSAESLVGQAEVFATAAMRPQAREAIVEALKLRCDEGQLVRAIGVCVRLGDLPLGVSIAQRAITANQKCAPAWRALMTIYELKGHYALALRAAQTLAALEPGDSRLKARVAKLKSLAGK